MDNTESPFQSAAVALNSGGRRANGKYIMFVHQDVELLSPATLREMEKALDSLQSPGIAGMSGACDSSPLVTLRSAEALPEIVQTLDECLVVIPKAVFDRSPFDEATCDDWHLYAVDYCLDRKNEGYDAYVIPLNARHLSMGTNTGLDALLSLGSLPRGYYRTMKKLLKKHKQAGSIHTTCGTWYTAYPLSVQRAWSWATAKLTMPFKALFRALR